MERNREGNWPSGITEDRTHNAQNEITAVGGTALAYDANGNLTQDEAGRQFVYDAWNRLVQVKDSSSVTLAGYNYDALNRRVTETHGTSRELYYSANWQVVEERESGLVVVQNVWSPVYVDALLLRDRDTDGNGSLDERLYAQQDANWNVTALVNTSGVVVERNAYTPYGVVTVLDANWVTRSSSAYDWIYLRQGKRRDLTTNQDDSRGRIYDAALGRPLQTDPLSYGAGDTNLYRWESNSPAKMVDPSGLDDIDWIRFHREYERAISRGLRYLPRPEDYRIPRSLHDIYFPDNSEHSRNSLMGERCTTFERYTPPAMYGISPWQFEQERRRTQRIEFMQDYFAHGFPTSVVIYVGGGFVGLPELGPITPRIQAPVRMPGVGGNGAASVLPSLNGLSRTQAINVLELAGFRSTRSGPTAGGWQTFRHPDGSQVDIGPGGRVVRTAAPRFGPDGSRINRGQRLAYDGSEIPRSLPHDQHPTETLSDD